MRKLLWLLPLALAACAPTALPSSPAAVANATVLDEQAMLGTELAYKAARVAVETGVDAGLIKGTFAARVAQDDGRAYAALQVVRQAYRAGNAQSYAAAIADAQKAVNNFLALTGKVTP